MDSYFQYTITEVSNLTSFPDNVRFKSLHCHREFQIVYCTAGMITISMLNGDCYIEQGEAIFLNSNVWHQDIISSDSAYYTFNFPKELVSFGKNLPTDNLIENFVENPGCPYHIFHKHTSWHKNVLSQCRKLIQLQGNDSDICCYEILHILTGIMLLMMKNLIIPQNIVVNHDELRMQKVLTYIEEHYSEEISLTALCTSANISKSGLLRTFHKTLGCTPYQYLINFRLNKAILLLKKTTMSIGEIASAVGINNQSQFGNYFKKLAGMTPSEFRRSHPREKQK